LCTRGSNWALLGGPSTSPLGDQVSGAVFAAISLGVVGGVLLGYLGGRRIAGRLSAGSSSPKIVLVCALAGGLLMLLPALFLSFVLGGNLGGGWGDIALGRIGVPIGIAAGIGVVLSVLLSSSALIGALLGKAVASFRSPNNRWRDP
jgi:hypothetical protein